MMRELKSDNAPAAIGPYSQGIEVDGLCFFSGQIALNPKSGDLIIDDFTAECKQVFSNIQGLLEDNSLTFQNVVKVNISLVDMGKFAQLNEIYSSYFSEPYPARACVAVAALPKGVNVEIEVIAKR